MRISNTTFDLDLIDHKIREIKAGAAKDTGVEAYISSGSYTPNPGAVPARNGISLAMKHMDQAVSAIVSSYPATKGKLRLVPGDEVYGFNDNPVIPQVGGLGHADWWLVYDGRVAFHPLSVALARHKHGRFEADAELQSLGLLAELK
jgi:hypothetical protein